MSIGSYIKRKLGITNVLESIVSINDQTYFLKNDYNSIINQVLKLQNHLLRIQSELNSDLTSVQIDLKNHISYLLQNVANKLESIDAKTDLLINATIVNLDSKIVSLDSKIVSLDSKIVNLDSKISELNTLEYYKNQNTKQSIDAYAAIFNKQYEKHQDISIVHLIKLIKSTTNIISSVVIGHYSKTLREEFLADTLFLEPAKFEKIALSDNKRDYFCPTAMDITLPNINNCIIINTALSNYIIKNNLVKDIHTKISDKLIMLFDNNTKNNVEIKWDSSFRASEETNGKYFRWCNKNKGQASINIINKAYNVNKAKITFNVAALNYDASLKIIFNGVSSSYDFKDTNPLYFEKEIDLVQGNNLFDFSYVGTPSTVEDSSETFYFMVSDFELNCNFVTIMGKNAYSTHFDQSVLPFVDNNDILNNLHSNGFFEVTSYDISNTDCFEICTSKYWEITNSYTSQCKSDSDSKLILYIAKRKGEYLK